MDNYLKIIYDKASKLNELLKRKTLVYIICSMRSGSTLLKSLLSNAPDTSYLPEIDFQKYNNKNSWRLKILSKAKIIILKKPALYLDKDYPQIPTNTNTKKIILVRDVYETVKSLKKMNQEIFPDIDSNWPLIKLANEYWYSVYSNILNQINNSEDTTLVRYEDLVKRPIEVTKTLFNFIGSIQQEGVNHYFPSENYDWKWGNDDGGTKIKTLQVQFDQINRNDQDLLDLIAANKKLLDLRRQLGYNDL